jgi:hypothetical protein
MVTTTEVLLVLAVALVLLLALGVRFAVLLRSSGERISGWYVGVDISLMIVAIVACVLVVYSPKIPELSLPELVLHISPKNGLLSILVCILVGFILSVIPTDVVLLRERSTPSQSRALSPTPSQSGASGSMDKQPTPISSKGA